MTQLASSSMGQETLTALSCSSGFFTSSWRFIGVISLLLIVVSWPRTSPTSRAVGLRPSSNFVKHVILSRVVALCARSGLSFRTIDSKLPCRLRRLLTSFSASAALAETSSLHPRVLVWDILLCSITLRDALVESGLKLLSLAMIGSATACLIRFVAAFFVARLKAMLLMTLVDASAIASISLGISFSAHAYTHHSVLSR